MDSLYDAPRRPPTPTKFEKINFKSLSVPEISIIAAEKSANPSTTSMQINRQLGQTLNDNEIYFRNCLPSKRVHFQSSSTNQLINDGRTYPTTNEHNKENVASDLPKKNFDLNGKTFKHIYMANIPNRDLDLSILEHNLVKTKQINDTASKKIDESIDFGRNFKEFKQKFSITAPRRLGNANYMPAKTYETHNNREINRNPTITTSLESTCRQVDKSVDCCDLLPTKSGDLERVTENQEPTIKDLLEIIKQQNQQIMSLQQQLFNLQNSLQNNSNQQQQQQLNEGLSKKFSIDLKATSFEVSFRPQKYQKFHNCEPTIQEIIETNEATKNDNQDELCLNLQQSIDVRETCPSPTPSIRIDMDDMQDYKSDDDDDDDNDEISTTLYDDIMGQVNKMLENVRLQNNQRNTNVTRETVQEVKEATIRYLNNDGRKLRYKPSEVSFAVKQLLLKYLPDEQLANFKINQPKIDNLPPKFNGNRGITNEFSIATLEYMKKYNLLNNRQQQQQQNDCLKRTRKNDNFLDISTLKLQPKLL